MLISYFLIKADFQLVLLTLRVIKLQNKNAYILIIKLIKLNQVYKIKNFNKNFALLQIKPQNVLQKFRNF